MLLEEAEPEFNHRRCAALTFASLLKRTGTVLPYRCYYYKARITCVVTLISAHVAGNPCRVVSEVCHRGLAHESENPKSGGFPS